MCSLGGALLSFVIFNKPSFGPVLHNLAMSYVNKNILPRLRDDTLPPRLVDVVWGVLIAQLMSFHRLKLMCSVGGVNVNRDLNQLASGAPDILVATPGR